MRRPLLGGLRWTLWLAAAGLPFSYGTRVLLARVSPDCLAIYGLLLVYIGYVAGFLFLGGNAVAIRYVPTLDAEGRRDFLGSYACILVAAWLPWLALAVVAPGWLGWLFGGLGGGFALLMVALAPLPIAFSLLLSALKGALDLACAQAFYRAVTVGTLVGVAVLVLAARPLLQAHAAWMLWGWYLVLMALGSAVAWRRWRRLVRSVSRWHWRLPPDFWGYTLGLQGSSMLGFFATQLDMLLVLHVGGLHLLGGYVAIMSLAALVTATLKLLLDAHMVAITQGTARQDAALTGELFHNCSRLLLPFMLLLAVALACFAPPLLSIYGSGYGSLAGALRWLGPCAAVASLNLLLGSSLSALGHPRAEIQAKCVRIAAYVALFVPLWRAWGIEGAVLAWGGAEIPYQLMHLFWLRRLAPFRLRWRRLYPAYVAVVALTAVLTQWRQPATLAAGAGMWVLLGALFFVLAGYSRAELGRHIRIFLPGAALEGGA
ncbi:MAG: lipopolysaccharide biosynthesis protein [Terriglobales bacterium]